MSENNFVKTKKIKKFLIIGFFLVFLFFYNIIFTQLIHDVGAKLPWAGWIGISDRSIYAVGDAGSCDITNPARNDECDENNICDGPVNPKQFQCNKTNIEQLYKAGNCDLKTCKCQRQWTIINSCTGNPQPVAGTAKCTDQGVRQQFAYSVCTSSTVNNCRSENPDQTGYCGTCASIKQWKTILPCTNGCVFAIDQPSTRCGASPVPGDSGIEQKFNCTQCVINAQGGSCPPTVEWRPTIDCGSPQNVVKQFCSNGVQCTMTVNYPGQCFYMDAQPTPCGCIDSTAKCDLYGNCTCVPPAVNGNTFTTCTTGSWVGGCKAPTVSMVCNGPCGVNGNNGNSGPCSPDGSTNTCADGTTQTCSSGTWGACNNGCASGTTDPHSVCNSDGTCTSASGCAASVDCTKCCPTGQNNPHYECQSDASCAEVNTCGADECSPGNAGTKCGCNPNDPTKKNCPCGGQQTCQADGTWSPCPAKHTECVKGDTGNVCQCVDGSGDDQCKAVGAQCGCCTPGDVADCTCGGQKTCGPDGNWSICSEHADCQNGVCACDNTSSGDDSCQIGASCSCTNGTTQNCPCGGTQTCTNGVWSACPACSCPGQCANGQTLPCPCGGTQQCVNGVWSQCPDKHTDCLNDICQCVDGLGSNNCTVVGASCVCNNGDKLNCPCGGTQTCTNGVWSACPAKHTDCLNGTCQCVDGSGPINCTTVGGSCCTSGQTKPCGDCGTRTCNSSGAWGTCKNQGSCSPGQTQSCANGGTRTCSPSCAWSSCQGSCTSGQTNPYFKCQNSICTVFNQCGTTNCSTCGGVYVSKCNPNGTCSPFGKGRPCNNSSDCSLTHCDENQQCVHGGTGPSCTSSVHCANDSTCGFDDDGNTECLAGDGGAYCSTANDCNFSAGCDINQQCVPGGIYGSCDPTNGDTDCQNATSCDYDPTSGAAVCVAGGGGTPCDPANGTADCPSTPGCDINQQCVPGGIYGSCDPTNGDTDCQNATSCDYDPTSGAAVCTPGGGGDPCTTVYDCPSTPGCDINQQCVPGGIYGSCDPSNGDTDCQQNSSLAATNLSVDSGHYCSDIQGAGLVIFGWTYSPQAMYQMQISTDSDFKNIVYDSCAANGDGINGPDCNGSANSVPVYVMFTSASSSTPHINYGVPYYWRVKVWRTNNGKDSGWIYYDGIAGTPKMRDAVKYAYPYLHPSPTMSYNISADASPTTPAVFTDLSLCYNSDGTSHYCNDSTLGASNTYKWWFKYPSENLSDISSYQVSSAPTSISYTYVLPGTYPTKLQVCDGAEPDSDNPDGCCSARNSATVRTTNAQKVPQWWEISPF